MSRKHALLSFIELKVIGFETFKKLYENDVDLAKYDSHANKVHLILLQFLMAFFFRIMYCICLVAL